MTSTPATNVTIPRGGGSKFVLAVAQARAIADEGGCALLRPADTKTEAAYLWLGVDGTYRTDSATLFRPAWLDRIERILNNDT